MMNADGSAPFEPALRRPEEDPSTVWFRYREANQLNQPEEPLDKE